MIIGGKTWPLALIVTKSSKFRASRASKIDLYVGISSNDPLIMSNGDLKASFIKVILITRLDPVFLTNTLIPSKPVKN